MNTPLPAANSKPSLALDGALTERDPVGDNSPEGPRDQTSSALRELAGSTERLMRESAEAARRKALLLRDSGTDYIRDRPLQSVLIAAGTGAMLVLLAGLLTRVFGAPR